MVDTYSQQNPAMGRGAKEALQRRTVDPDGEQKGSIVGRKRTAAARLEIEERYKALFERSRDAIYLHDFEGNFIDANDAALNLLGYTRDEMSSMGFRELLTPDQRPLASHSLKELLETGTQEGTTEYRLRRKDGAYVWVETKASLLYRAGKPIAVQGIARDITQRKRMEQMLRESEELVHTVVTDAPIVLFALDREGICTFAAGQPLHESDILDLMGLESKDLAGRSIFDLLPDLPGSKERFHRALAGERFTSTDEAFGHVFETRLSPLRGQGGETIGIIGVATDVTERVQAQTQIQRRNEELAAHNTIAAAVSRSLDLDQILNVALKEVLQLNALGAEAKAMICLLDQHTGELALAAQQGGAENCLYSVASIPRECHPCRRAIQRGEVIVSDDCWQNEKLGSCWRDRAPHKETCLPLKAGGKVLGIMNLWLPATQELTSDDLSLLTLISEQVGVAIQNAQLYEAVWQQHEQLRALAARLGEVEELERKRLARELHDRVGQNLTALGINLTVLQAQIPDTLPCWNAIQTRLEDSLALVEQTVEHTRDVMANLRPAVLDDYGLVAALHWYGERFTRRTGIHVALQGDIPEPRLRGRVEDALFRIVQEALTNVARHAQTTDVTVTVEADDTTVRLTVSDDGVGFDPVRLPQGDRRQGWGLRTMIERAEAVGGRCHIASSPHEGTRVIVEVPP